VLKFSPKAFSLNQGQSIILTFIGTAVSGASQVQAGMYVPTPELLARVSRIDDGVSPYVKGEIFLAASPICPTGDHPCALTVILDGKPYVETITVTVNRNVVPTYPIDLHIN